jgi:polyphosphate kinase
MHRNFDRRIEIVFPIEDERIKSRLVNEILAAALLDDSNVRLLQPDGTHQRPRGGFNCQEVLEQIAAGARCTFSLPPREAPKPRPAPAPAAPAAP